MFLQPKQADLETEIRKLGIEPKQNYLLCQHRMDPKWKFLAHLTLRAPAIFIPFFEKNYLVVFSKREILLRGDFGKRVVTRIKRQDVKNFTSRKGVNHAIIFTFDANGQHYEFYAYADSAGRVAYVAENLRVLQGNGWQGYLG